MKTIRDIIIEKVGEDRKGETVQIPCPYNKPVCLVYHCETRLTEYDKGYNAAKEEMRGKAGEIEGEIVKLLSPLVNVVRRHDLLDTDDVNWEREHGYWERKEEIDRAWEIISSLTGTTEGGEGGNGK